ncbi:hypothetical protein D3C81_302540 [compost metagenome]
MCGGARTFGIAGQHRIHHFAVLVGQRREGPGRGVQLLPALRDVGLQQLEQPAHHLQQHQVVRGLGDGQVEGRIGLGFAGRIILAMRVHHGLERLRDAGAVLVGGAQRRVPGRGAFQRVADFQHVEAVFRVALEQRQVWHQGLIQRLPCPCGGLAHIGATTHACGQQTVAGQLRDGLAQRGARDPQLNRQRALGRQPVARLQLPFLHQRTQLRGHLVRNPLCAHGAIVARSTPLLVGLRCMLRESSRSTSRPGPG